MGAIFIIIFAILRVTISVPMCYNDSGTICKLCEDYTDSDCREITDDIRTIFSYRTKEIDYNFFVGTNVKVIKEQKITTFYSCNNDYIHVNRSTFYPTGLKPNFTISYMQENKYTSVATADRSKFRLCLDTYCLNEMYNTLVCHHYYLPLDQLEFNFGTHVTPMCLQNITSGLISVRHLNDLKNNKFFRYACNLINLIVNVEILDSFECNIFGNLLNLRMLEIQLYGVDKHPLVEHYKCVFYSKPNLVSIRINDKLIWNKCNNTAVSERNVSTLWGTFVFLLLLLIAIYLLIMYSFYMSYWSPRHITAFEDPGYELHTIRTEYI